jgi:glutamyl-tRNA reductase
MNMLVVGVSHHTAPVELLERLSVSRDETPGFLTRLMGTGYVAEAVVLSTCNRVEVYAAVSAFHGGLTDIGAALAERAGIDLGSLAPHLYVHFDADAARHAFRVAAGLDSMVVGESQILGQLREAYQLATEREFVGRLLHESMQQALRVAKRIHTETAIDRAGQSIVSAALALAPGGVAGRSALVIGAGSMGALALATLARAGAGPLRVTNRGTARAAGAASAHGAEAVPFDALADHIAAVDLVVCATASIRPVLTADLVASSISGRDGRPLVLLDLAVPRDVAPDVADLPGVVLIDLAAVGTAQLDAPSTADRAAAEAIVGREVETFLEWMRGRDVAPTVAALRARADDVVGAELRRLANRRPDLTDEQRAEVANAVHRVVQQLLHEPTVRVRQMAAAPGGDQYLTVLRELFDLAVPDPGDNLARAAEVRPIDENATAENEESER